MAGRERNQCTECAVLMKLHIPQSAMVWKPDWELPPSASGERNGSWKAKFKLVFTYSDRYLKHYCYLLQNYSQLSGSKIDPNVSTLLPNSLAHHATYLKIHVKLTKYKPLFFPARNTGIYRPVYLDTGLVLLKYSCLSQHRRYRCDWGSRMENSSYHTILFMKKSEITCKCLQALYREYFMKYDYTPFCVQCTHSN